MEKDALPKKMKPTTINLLINGKLLLQHAISHSFTDSTLDRMITILGIDHTNEFILNTIAEDFDIDISINTIDIGSIAGEINKFLKDNYETSLPYLREIKQIRNIRNLVQHAQSDPNPKELDKYVKITEKFFDKILIQFFGLTKEKVFISSIIENDLIKNFIAEAEKCLDSNEDEQILRGIVACRDAFENQILLQSENFSINHTLMPALMENRKDIRFWFYETVHDHLLMISLGVDINKYNRFARYMDHIPREFAPHNGSWIIMQRPWNNSDLKFCYNFVVDLILKWQNEKFPPLYTPVLNREYTREEMFCGIDTTNYMSTYHYFSNNKSIIKKFILDGTQKDVLLKIKLDTEYEYGWKLFVDGEFERDGTQKIKLNNRHHKLLVNNPEKWEVVISYIVIDKN